MAKDVSTMGPSDDDGSAPESGRVASIASLITLINRTSLVAIDSTLNCRTQPGLSDLDAALEVRSIADRVLRSARDVAATIAEFH
ncbi:MAG: hypothetical protein P4M00_24205 [Azospirillaceae bacterium]|nr:hypothetical protein [Azospirillaceae bacterium]